MNSMSRMRLKRQKFSRQEWFQTRAVCRQEGGSQVDMKSRDNQLILGFGNPFKFWGFFLAILRHRLDTCHGSFQPLRYWFCTVWAVGCSYHLSTRLLGSLGAPKTENAITNDLTNHFLLALELKRMRGTRGHCINLVDHVEAAALVAMLETRPFTDIHVIFAFNFNQERRWTGAHLVFNGVLYAEYFVGT